MWRAPDQPDPLAFPEIRSVDLTWCPDARSHPRFERDLHVGTRQARLLTDAPWVRSLGKLSLHVKTEAWRFPAPPDSATECTVQHAQCGHPTFATENSLRAEHA